MNSTLFLAGVITEKVRAEIRVLMIVSYGHKWREPVWTKSKQRRNLIVYLAEELHSSQTVLWWVVQVYEEEVWISYIYPVIPWRWPVGPQRLVRPKSFFLLAIYTSNERIEDRPFFFVEQQPYLGGESLPHFTHTWFQLYTNKCIKTPKKEKAILA